MNSYNSYEIIFIKLNNFKFNFVILLFCLQ